MTKEEAIKIIESARAVVLGNGEYDKAMAMAIEALKTEPIKHGIIELTYEEYGELCSYAFADEQKHGEWLIDKSGSLMCSKCGTLLDEAQKPSRYCPNCGARMDGGENGYWYHGNGKIGGEFHPTKPNDKGRYGEYVKVVRCKDCKHHADEEIGMVYCPNVVGG